MYRYTKRTAAARTDHETAGGSTAASSRAEPFRRDAPTRLSYGALAAFAFWLYAFGPALALLRGELHFSYGLIGVYSAVWSAGAALAGMSFAALAGWLRRGTLLWSSGTAATAGAGLFAATHTVAPTLAAATMLGFFGTILLGSIQAILSDSHGERRDRVLAEANVGAAACGVLAPLLLGLLQGTPAGWRAAMGVPALILAGLYLRYRHQALPEPPAKPAAGQQPRPGSARRRGRAGTSRVRLSRTCWILAALVAVGIAVEFCVIYFGAEMLTATGLRTAQAATAMSGFYLGILVGRLGGVWLIRRAGRTVALLWASLAVTMAGFLLFWLAGSPEPAIAGLFLCGLGIANLYPLSLALALAAAPGNEDSANGTTQLLGGVLVVAFPYLLGSLADHLGLHAAFTIELVLIGACAVLLLAGLRMEPAQVTATTPSS